jgi:hypothetical protein
MKKGGGLATAALDFQSQRGRYFFMRSMKRSEL